MSDELDLDLDSETPLDADENKQRNDRELKRNKDLSDKLRTEGEARVKAVEEAEAAKLEADFYKNFNSLATKYQGASEFQDQIKERVAKGYDPEEATVAVLAKEGKYIPPVTQESPPPSPESPAGGSAVNNIPIGGEKPLTEMNKGEKQAALEEAINKGEISFTNL